MLQKLRKTVRSCLIWYCDCNRSGEDQKMKKYSIVALILVSVAAYGQRVENTSLYRNIGSDKYFRISYDNDFFALSDRYYTQGINLEFVSPALQKFPLAKLLVKNKNLITKTGMALEHSGFTPTNVLATEVLRGDRPYSSSLMLKTFSIISNPYTNHRLTTQLTLGVIGPWAMGKEVQVSIHERINPNKVPQGWNNQIRNDIILNYQVDYEHGLWMKRNFILTGKAGARAGTYNTRLNSSFTILAGLFDNPFEFANTRNKNFQAYLYAEPQFNLIVYDATLQGGLFNNGSPYTIARNEISRVVFQQNAGLVIKIKGIILEYAQTIITKEFKTGFSHSWGSVRLAFAF